MAFLKDGILKIENWVIEGQPPQKGSLRLLYTAGRTAYAVVRDIVDGNLTLHAMSLVYTTLLSVVPLLALSFSVLKAMGAHHRMEPLLFQFFEPMGSQGLQVAEQILGFVDNMKVGVLGSVGLALLIYTVISLIQKIESSFNEIWRVSGLRSVGQRFSNYLSVILVGPLLMVSAMGLSATIFSSTIVMRLMEIEPFGSLILFFARFTPFFLVVAAFTFVYVFVPNTRVQIRYAFVGGLIAGVLWQGGSLAFAAFVSGSTRYEAIYSSFAIGIFLLIWIYLNWMILLLGASISFYLQHPGSVARRKYVSFSPELQERVALVLMWLVCKPFAEGKPPPGQERLEHQLRVPGDVTRSISDKLIRGGLLNFGGANGDRLVPARTLDAISIGDVLSVIRKDEDQIVGRLPDILPPGLTDPPFSERDQTFGALLKNHGGNS
ncbi:MAG: YhjD/YihY/BrkB family envelope integrity protein [Desulfosalsimonadaceae bacterium]